MKTTNKYSPEIRERGVRMVYDHQDEYESQWAAIRSIAVKLGWSAETLRKWVRQSEISQGKRDGLVSSEQARLKELERENRELKRANEILRKAGFFRPGGARPPTEIMVSFIDKNREDHGVEPICRQLAMAPSTSYIHTARVADSERLPKRIKRTGNSKSEYAGSMKPTSGCTVPVKSGGS
jgi:putative transposase